MAILEGKIHKKHSIRSLSFDEQILNQGVLSLYLSAGMVALTVADRKEIRLLESYSYDADQKEYPIVAAVRQLMENQLVKGSYAQKIVLLNTTKYTLVPSAYFLEDDIKTFYAFNHKPDGEQIYYDKISTASCRNVYGVFPELVHLFDYYLGDYELKHSLSVMLDTLMMQHKATLGKKCFLNVRDNVVDIIAMEGRKLLLCNSYHYTAPEDMVFFTLNAIKNANLDIQTSQFYLMGDIHLEDARYKMLNEFINHLIFSKRPELNNYVKEFDQIPSHQYFNLFCSII